MRQFAYVFLAVLLVALAAVRAQSIWPTPPTPAGNPTTPDKVLLGKALFYDEQLASSNAIACGTCHVPGRDGTDPRAPSSVHPGADCVFGTADDGRGSPGVPLHDSSGLMIANATFGVQWQVSHRRAPPLVNSAYQPSVFVDGRADGVFRDPRTGDIVLTANAALEHQALEPLLSTAEMAHVDRDWRDVTTLIERLVPLAVAERVPPAMQSWIGGRRYPALFARAFGTPEITPTRIAFALAAYQRTLVSDGSPFDRYLAGQGTLSPLARHGLTVFERFCADCHTGLSAAVLATGPVHEDFRNTGVRPPATDLGRAQVTGATADRGKFRVPDLRNVALRSTWFHDGSGSSLADVLAFYDRGGDHADNRDPLVDAIRGQLTPRRRAALLALLHSLTDPRVASELPPFDRPRLWIESVRVPTAFGVGTAPHTPRPPRISALGTVYHGNDTFGVGVDRIAPGLFTALMVDLVGSPAPSLYLGMQVHLGVSPALLALPLGATKTSPDGSGYNSHIFHVPPSQAAPGTYWIQWVALDPTAANLVISSDAMRLVIP